MSLTTTTDAEFAATVLDSELPVLVEFTAAWCPPCRMVEPVLAQIAVDEATRLRVVSIDVDENQSTARKYQVMGMPTFALFGRGEVLTQFTGARPRAAIMRALEPHLESAP